MQKVEVCYGELDTQSASGVLESGRWKVLKGYVCHVRADVFGQERRSVLLLGRRFCGSVGKNGKGDRPEAQIPQGTVMEELNYGGGNRKTGVES